MARLFDDGSSEYLLYNGAVLTGEPISMACWFYSDSTTINQVLVAMGNTGAGDWGWFRLGAMGDVAGDPIRVQKTPDTGGAGGSADTTAGYSANTWHHACGVFSADAARAVYLDGANKGTDVTNVADPTPDNATIGAVVVGDGIYGYMSGRICEAAAWNVALSDVEVAILAHGFSPLFVHPQNLVAYWALVRDEDQDRVGGYDMTAVNAPSVAAHCPKVIYPAAVISTTSAAAAASTVPMKFYHYMHH